MAAARLVTRFVMIVVGSVKAETPFPRQGSAFLSPTSPPAGWWGWGGGMGRKRGISPIPSPATYAPSWYMPRRLPWALWASPSAPGEAPTGDTRVWRDPPTLKVNLAQLTESSEV